MPAVPSIADVVAVVLQLCGPLYAELSIVDVMSHIYDTPMIGATTRLPTMKLHINNVLIPPCSMSIARRASCVTRACRAKPVVVNEQVKMPFHLSAGRRPCLWLVIQRAAYSVTRLISRRVSQCHCDTRRSGTASCVAGTKMPLLFYT